MEIIKLALELILKACSQPVIRRRHYINDKPLTRAIYLPTLDSPVPRKTHYEWVTDRRPYTKQPQEGFVMLREEYEKCYVKK